MSTEDFGVELFGGEGTLHGSWLLWPNGRKPPRSCPCSCRPCSRVLCAHELNNPERPTPPNLRARHSRRRHPGPRLCLQFFLCRPVRRHPPVGGQQARLQRQAGCADTVRVSGSMVQPLFAAQHCRPAVQQAWQCLIHCSMCRPSILLHPWSAGRAWLCWMGSSAQ